MTVSRSWALRALLAAPLVPLAAGRWMVTYQDAIMTHLPAKAATVEQLRAGAFPFLNPYASFGEPLAGNQNFGTFFPDMLAFLVLPLPAAFGLRFALNRHSAYKKYAPHTTNKINISQCTTAFRRSSSGPCAE